MNIYIVDLSYTGTVREFEEDGDVRIYFNKFGYKTQASTYEPIHPTGELTIGDDDDVS